ncbi:TadE family protein [Kitasatospora sp. NPDC058170]|uniref:TadE family protein n=1 Tax=Kitasatospora sp. NPDC058170 TaxID=3346364 RepID=UPI0036DB68DD
MRSGRGRDGGGVAIEAAIVAPAVVTLILLAIAAGRVQTTASGVEAAARSAARTVSLARTVDATAADRVAEQAAREVLAQQGIDCGKLDVAAEDGILHTESGDLTTVTVRVSCTVGLSDLVAGPNLPVTKTLIGRFVSVVDRYRGR